MVFIRQQKQFLEAEMSSFAAEPVLPVLLTKPHRDDVPKDKVLCEYCSAKCCRYFALTLDTPTTREDFEFLRWFLLHDTLSFLKARPALALSLRPFFELFYLWFHHKTSLLHEVV